ncbi:MAG: ATP-dependent Clp protease proteolytic subunit [Candidatus Niyogibacteria bacterium]|nr:ATP-dependent Clp protease proteolytic subunit [Candidatus Niyogibacteria bacterium]
MNSGQARRMFYKKLGVIVDLDGRKISLNGLIVKETGFVFHKALHVMQSESVEEPITINILRSGGGSCITSIMIYAMLRICAAPVKSVVRYYAKSGACYIFEGASERVMMSGSFVELHWAVLPGFDDCLTVDDIKVEYDYLLRMNNHIYNMIRERTGMPMGAIKKLCKTSAPINPKQAIQLGLADKIGGRKSRKHKK